MASDAPGAPKVSAFTARAGTGDEGKDFEELMIISKCLELTFDSNIMEFSISSDDAAFGDFDDLVIEMKYINGEERKIAYQLKHVEAKDKLLTPKILGGTGDKFSISKYYKSCSKIPADFSLILYTNKKFEMKSAKLTMNCNIGAGDNIPVDILTTNQENQFEFTMNKTENISEETETYEKFLNRFQLMSNQENVKQLENRTRNEFLRIHGNEDTFRRFRDFIKRWKKAKRSKLDKEIISIKIVESLLSPFVKTIGDDLCQTDLGDILRKAILSFKFTIFDETNEVIHRIWMNNMSNPEINKCGFKNFLLTESLDTIKYEKLRGHKYSLIAWHLGQCPLIVEVTKDSRAAIQEAVVLLEKNGIDDRKLLLLGQKEVLHVSGCFRNLNSLKTVNEALYQEIVETFSCSLQGRFHKLKEIVYSEDFEKTVNTDCLVKTSNLNFNIGEVPTDLPEFYVPRVLPRIMINFKFLEETKIDLILINCNDQKELVKKRIKDLRTVDVKELLSDHYGRSDYNKQVICLHPTECSSEEYSKITTMFPRKNCHHFNYRDGYIDLEWINTRGDAKSLQSYRAANEVFEKEDEFLHRSRTVKVVCADPGMGKTTMLKHFYSSKNKPCWLLHIVARQYASATKENMDVQNFVFSFANDSLEKRFLETFYDRREIIFMWDGLDEVLDHGQRHRIYGFIKNVEQLGFVQVITSRCNLQEEIEEKFSTLATRIEELTKFEQNLFLKNRLSRKYNDEQLSNLMSKITENVEYLETERILGVPFQLYLMTELFLQTSNIDDVIREPLTATTLLEHFVSNKVEIHFGKFQNEDIFSKRLAKKTAIKGYMLLGIKICLESIADLNFLEQSELHDLTAIQTVDDRFGFVRKLGQLSLFVHQSYAEYFAALFLSENYGRITSFKKMYFDDRCRNLRFMLDLILAKDCPVHAAVLCRNLKILEARKEEILRQDAAGRDALHIALSWGRDHLQLPDVVSSAAIEVENYFDKLKVVGRILRFMLEDKRELVHIFDEMCQMDYSCYSNESLLEMAVVTNDLNVVKFIYENESMRRMENGLSLVYATFIGNQEICEFLITHGAKVNFSSNSATPLMYAAARGYFDIAKVLIDNKAEISMTDGEGRDPLFFAVENKQLAIIELLVENNPELNLPNKTVTAPLITAARKGHLDIAKILIDNNTEINVTDSEGRSPLFFAADSNQLAMVQLLIVNSAEVNLQAREGSTPLIVAVCKGHFDIGKILIDNKADVNMTESKARSPLYFSAENKPMVQLLIENGAEVNLSCEGGCTPLMKAAFKGYVDIAKILIDKAEVNMTDNEGRSPLYFATDNSQLAMVQLLIENTAEVNLPNKDGLTPLLISVFKGHFDIAKILIDNKADVTMRESKGRSPLHFAADNNQLTMVQLLIENGAEVNLPSEGDCTPLTMAAFKGYVDIAKILIDNKAQINMTDSEGRSPLYFAADNNQLRMAQLLIENNAEVNLPNKYGTSPLIIAACRGQLDIAKILINNMAEANATDSQGRGPLHFAVAINKLHLVQLLVENGANVNVSDKMGVAPLIFAAQEGLLAIASILIDNKADVNITENEGRSPLYFAAEYDRYQLVRLLVKNNADVNLPNKYGITPLMIAAYKVRLIISGILIDNKAEVNMTDGEGRSPLFYAVENNQLPTVGSLISRNAEINLPTKGGISPLMIAAYKGHLVIANLLLRNNAEVNATDSEGRSPLYFAVENNQPLLISILVENNADANLPTKGGITPLMLAASKGQSALTQSIFVNNNQ